MAKKTKAEAKKKAIKTKRKNNKKLQRFVFMLNCILFMILAILVAYEFVGFKGLDEIYNGQDLPPRVYTHRTQIKTPKQDADFIKEALQIDEMGEEDIFHLENALKQTHLQPPPILDSWEDKISHINKIEMHSEDLYRLYEEKLPDDIKLPTAPIQPAKPPYFGKKPVIAIVIDDMGISHRRTKDIASLHYPITASFLTYASNLNEQITVSKKAGQEIIAHLPMQPKKMQNISPDVLTVKMSNEQVRKGIVQMLAKFKDIKGVNNHMGSQFTESNMGMDIVMEELSKQNLYFLDSKTTAKSVADQSAKKHRVKYASRNVFLDNVDDFNYVMKQLKYTELVARQNGYAIAIGHPKAQTYNALKAWLPTLKQQNIKLVPLSQIVDVLNKK